MSSKLTLSILAAIAISAAGGVARANPIPTSTDDARAQAGSSAPAPISPSVQALIARDADEGRAAAFAGDQDSGEKQQLSATPAGSSMEQGN